MLGFNQSDGLGQGRPLPPDQPIVEFVQQPLLRSAQVLDRMFWKPRAHTPGPHTAAVARRGALAGAGGGSKDPSMEAACPRHRGGGEGVGGCDVAEKGDAKWSHSAVIAGHLEEKQKSRIPAVRG